MSQIKQKLKLLDLSGVKALVLLILLFIILSESQKFYTFQLYRYDLRFSDVIVNKIPNTYWFGLCSSIVSSLVAIGMLFSSATRRLKWSDSEAKTRVKYFDFIWYPIGVAFTLLALHSSQEEVRKSQISHAVRNYEDKQNELQARAQTLRPSCDVIVMVWRRGIMPSPRTQITTQESNRVEGEIELHRIALDCQNPFRLAGSREWIETVNRSCHIFSSKRSIFRPSSLDQTAVDRFETEGLNHFEFISASAEILDYCNMANFLHQNRSAYIKSKADHSEIGNNYSLFYVYLLANLSMFKVWKTIIELGLGKRLLWLAV